MWARPSFVGPTFHNGGKRAFFCRPGPLAIQAHRAYKYRTARRAQKVDLNYTTKNAKSSPGPPDLFRFPDSRRAGPLPELQVGREFLNPPRPENLGRVYTPAPPREPWPCVHTRPAPRLQDLDPHRPVQRSPEISTRPTPRRPNFDPRGHGYPRF